MLEMNKNVLEFNKSWKIKKGLVQFFNLPFKKTLRDYLMEKRGFTSQIYKLMEAKSLEAEQNDETWEFINKNRTAIKCNLLYTFKF